MLTDPERERMARALLTDGERAAVRGDEEMSASTRSSHLSRVRGKLSELETDAQLLRENDPDLYEQVRDAVVEEELTARIERLEAEVEELREEVAENED